MRYVFILVYIVYDYVFLLTLIVQISSYIIKTSFHNSLNIFVSYFALTFFYQWYKMYWFDVHVVHIYIYFWLLSVFKVSRWGRLLLLDDEWTFETKSTFLRNLLLCFIHKCPFSFVKNKLVSGATTIQVEGLIQTKVVIKISKYYEIS